MASYTVAVPAAAGMAEPVVKVLATGAGGEIHWVDDIDIHVGSGATFVPGGYTNDQGGLILERGEFLDSSRGPVENIIHPQAAGGMMTRNRGQGIRVDNQRK